MNRSLLSMVSIAALAPIAVELPALDESVVALPGETRIGAAGGIAYYAFIARGCEGQEIDHLGVHARDGAFVLEHRFESKPIRLGVRAGWVRDEIDPDSTGPLFIGAPTGVTLTNTYVNPHVSFEGPRGGMGLGYIWHEREFTRASQGVLNETDYSLNDLSGHVVIGHPDRKHFAVRWMESVPLYSGGGYLTLGLGGRHGPVDLESGATAGGPYDRVGAFLNGRYGLASGVCIGLGLVVGGDNETRQAGASLSLEYRTRAARP